jgi:dTDP-4-dehydrorhamnose reductase
MYAQTLLILGKGFLGSRVFHVANKEGFKTMGSNYEKENELTIDIRDINDVEKKIKQVNPDYLINTASRNDIDFLEKHPQIAMKVNRDGASNVAKICREHNVRLVHISTDSVFDGSKGMYTENDIPNPINMYGRSKYEGELEVRNCAPDSVVIRTNFYGIDERGRYFFNWILDSIKMKNEIIGFDDVIFSPLDIDTLSKAIIEIMCTNYTGIVHLSSGQPMSKYQFIKKVVDFIGRHSVLRRGSISAQQFIAQRPRDTSLNNDLAKSLFKIKIPDLNLWMIRNKDAIEEYLK